MDVISVTQIQGSHGPGYCLYCDPVLCSCSKDALTQGCEECVAEVSTVTGHAQLALGCYKMHYLSADELLAVKILGVAALLLGPAAAAADLTAWRERMGASSASLSTSSIAPGACTESRIKTTAQVCSSSAHLGYHYPTRCVNVAFPQVSECV